MTTDGEVAIRQNGHEHAVDAPRLDGQLHVDLDHGMAPRLRVPSEVAVEYYDDDDGDEDYLETDGGENVHRTMVSLRGNEIPEEVAGWALVLSGLLLAMAGYVVTTDASGLAVLSGAGGVMLAIIAGPSYWSDRS